MIAVTDFKDALVFIGSRLSAERFGTSFIIEQTGFATRILTCQHVIDTVGNGNIENLRVGDGSRKIFCLAGGAGDSYDLAVLEVTPSIEGTPVPIVFRECGPAITLEGFQNTGTSYMRLPLKGEVRKSISLLSRKTDASAPGWQIEIEEGYTLEPGYSGSPVADTSLGAVFGVVKSSGEEGQKGLILSLRGLEKIWPESARLIIDNKIVVSCRPQDKELTQRLIAGLSEKLPFPITLHVWDIMPALACVLALCKTLLLVCGDSLADEWQAEPGISLLKHRVANRLGIIPVITAAVGQPPPLADFVPPNVCCSYKGDSDLNRILWAITGENPLAQQIVSPSVNRSSLSVTTPSKDIARSFKNGSLTFVVGCARPPESDIVGKLISEILEKNVDLPRAFLPLDFAGSCYAIDKSDDQLDDEIRQLFNFEETPKLYTDLCGVIQQGLNKAQKRLKTNTAPQVIVTTNLDLHLEIALLQKGIPFLRVVHDRSCKRLHVSEFSRDFAEESINESIVRIRERLDEMQPQLIEDRLEDRLGGQAQNPIQALNLGTAPVVLYKLLGSAEIQRSAVLTSEQLFSYIRAVQSRGMMPIAIWNILANNDLLFIGYGHLDLFFRITQHLLPPPATSNRRYLIQACPPNAVADPLRSLERMIWSGLKERRVMDLQMKTIEDEPSDFILRLQDQLAAHV